MSKPLKASGYSSSATIRLQPHERLQASIPSSAEPSQPTELSAISMNCYFKSLNLVTVVKDNLNRCKNLSAVVLTLKLEQVLLSSIW